MTLDTVLRLNRLNHDFYRQIAEDFDSTRQLSWPGWLQLVPRLEKVIQQYPPLKVLDVGCGNGRFGQFLVEHIGPNHIEYTGTDLNQALLTKAQLKLDQAGLKTHFQTQDLVDLVLKKQISTVFPVNHFGLVSLLGVLHHLPSFELRTQLLSQVIDLLAPQGLLVFTTWQFMEFERIKNKRVEPSLVGFNPDELEENDYFLDWERGQLAYRYCHYFNEDEHRRLVAFLKTKATLVDEFRADGKEGNMDQYFVFQRNSA